VTTLYVADRPRRRLRRRIRFDAATALVCYVVLLVAIPSALVVGPLGAAGTPAGLFGVFLLGWWISERAVGRFAVWRAKQPTRARLYAFQISILLSYVAGMLRPIYSEEIRSADRGLISVAAWSGVALIAADGIGTRDRLDRVLKTLVMAGAALASVGILQFFTGFDLAQYMKLPGLSTNVGFGLLSERSNFRRVTGTTMHPIEFGVVLTLILPIALHYAFHARAEERRRQWFFVAVIAAALPMCVARSAILGAAIVLLLVFPTWSRQAKLRALVILPVGALLMRLMVPGLLGTIRSLFSNIQNDPSTQGRTADFVAAGHYISLDPVFGRGFSTFLPDIYRTLDDAYLGILIEAGLVGLLALLALFVGAMLQVRHFRSMPVSAVDKSIAHALFTSVAVALVTFVTFDALGFRMCAGVTFLLLGCCGAHWRLRRAGQAVPQARVPFRVRRSRKRVVLRRLVTVPVAALAVAVVVSQVHRAPAQYQAVGATVLVADPQPGNNPYLESPDVTAMTYALNQVLASDQTRAAMAAHGLASDFTVAETGGSLATDTDVDGRGPSLSFAVTNESPTVAVATIDQLIDTVGTELSAWQQAASVPTTRMIRSLVLSRPQSAVWVHGSDKRALAGIVFLGIVGWLLLDRTFTNLFGPARPQSRLVPA
jgi:O-antigen ligase